MTMTVTVISPASISVSATSSDSWARRHGIRGWLTVALFLTIVPATSARGVYQQPSDFLAEVFGGSVPKPAVLWLTADLRPAVTEILGHPPGMLRLRYWKRDDRSAWILAAIGKEQPITTGIVIHHDRIERIRILAFRESRGWEVRHSAFTDQFRDAGLQRNLQLDRHIDGITGATLSVRAVKKLARLALYLHGVTEGPDDPP